MVRLVLVAKRRGKWQMNRLKFFRCPKNIPQAWAPSCIRSLPKTGVESNCQWTEHYRHVQVRSLRHATFSWLRSIVLKFDVDSNCQQAEHCPHVQVRSFRHATFSKGGSCGPAELVGKWIKACYEYFVWLLVPVADDGALLGLSAHSVACARVGLTHVRFLREGKLPGEISIE